MKSLRTERCHVGLSREFVGTACCTYGQSNTTYISWCPQRRYNDAFPLDKMYHILWNASKKYSLFEPPWSPISAVCRYSIAFQSTAGHQTRAYFSLCLIRNPHNYNYLAPCRDLINILMNSDNWCQDEYGINLLLHWVQATKLRLWYQLHMKSYTVIGPHNTTIKSH